MVKIRASSNFDIKWQPALGRKATSQPGPKGPGYLERARFSPGLALGPMGPRPARAFALCSKGPKPSPLGLALGLPALFPTYLKAQPVGLGFLFLT